MEEHKEHLQLLAATLLEHETLSGEQIEELLGTGKLTIGVNEEKTVVEEEDIVETEETIKE